MSDNQPSPWGEFYATLHQVAQELREKMTAASSTNLAGSEDAAGGTEPTEAGQFVVNHSMLRRAGQMEARE